MVTCQGCGEPVATADAHVLPAEEWRGQRHNGWTCREPETREETARRIVKDGLGGRREPGKDEL